MDPFAFNGAVLGLSGGDEASAPAAPSSTSGDANSKMAKLAAAAVSAAAPPLKPRRAEPAPAGRASAEGPFSIARASTQDQNRSAGHSSNTAAKRRDVVGKSAAVPAKATPVAAASSAASKKRAATATTAAEKPQAAPLKSALKASARVDAATAAQQAAARTARSAAAPARTSNTEGLRALSALLTAPPTAEDPVALEAAASKHQKMRKSATELAKPTEELTETQQALAEKKKDDREARFASVKAKVKEAKSALVQRQKQVSAREPDAAADPDAARDRLFGKPPSSALAAADASATSDAAEAASASSSSTSDDDAAEADVAEAAAAAAPSPAVEEVELPPLEELLHPRLAQAVAAMEITQLTRVQKLAWPSMIGPDDVLVRSETGSGKTLAYGLPMLHMLLKRCDEKPIERGSAGTICIVMAPTRELAEQCSTVLTKCVRKANFIVVGSVHGGEDRHKEKARLRKGITVLVATPGRLFDHLQSTAAFNHSNLHTVVMDEADRLLDMGFERSIAGIMDLVKPVKRILVSATITPAVERLSHFALSKPIRVGETEDKFEVPTSLRQHFTVVPCKHRLVALTAVLLAQLEAAARKIIVFVSTADATEFMYLLFSRLRSPFDSSKPDPAAALQVRGRVANAAMHAGTGYGRKKDTERANRHVRDGGAAEEMSGADGGGIESAIADAKRRAIESLAAKTSGSGNLSDEDALLRSNVFKLHGNMTQVDRSSVFNAFRTCEKGVLFCTDVAARGLDMPSVSWIIHYDPPTDDRSYIHRIGRTARIGSIGDSLLMLMEHERAFVPEYLAQATNSQIREKPLAVLMYHLSRIDNNAPSWADSAAKLQHAAANLVKYDEVLNRVALFAYRSMIRAYAAYPRDVRRFFDQSQLHLGHVAASFAIDATPTALRRAGHKHVTEDRNLGRDRTRFRKEGAQIQLDTHDKYRSTLATKASRETKDWLEAKRAEGTMYKPMGHSSTAEFDA